jgi:surface antigen
VISHLRTDFSPNRRLRWRARGWEASFAPWAHAWGVYAGDEVFNFRTRRFRASGAGTGGLIGNGGGAVLDDQDRKRAYAAEIQALEAGPSGVPVPWRNPDSGRYGNVVPGPSYLANGFSCRQFMETVYADGRPQTGRWVACRNPDGTWFID